MTSTSYRTRSTYKRAVHGITHDKYLAPAWQDERPQIWRQRLVDQLERRTMGSQHQLHRADVMLLSASAGFGKTTLLAQWATITGDLVVWFHLDSSDDDPVNFVYGYIQAFRTVLPRSKWRVEDLLTDIEQETLTPPDIRHASKILIDDMRTNVTRPATVIFTGIDELSRKGAARALLNRLVARSHDQIRFVLESRDIPALTLSPLLPQGRLEAIQLDDLRFTDEEVATLLEQLGLPVDPSYLAQVQELCGGWITGILLATGTIWPESLLEQVSDNLNREAIFSYLAQEVIEQLPADLIDFATRTAILRSLTAPQCAALSGWHGDAGVAAARQKLAAMERHMGFISHEGRRPKEPSYHIQPIVRQALLDRLLSLYGIEDPIRDADAATAILQTLQCAAGDALLLVGEYEEAIQQYTLAQHYSGVLQVINTQHQALLRGGYGATLARWLDLLPAEEREQYPELQLVLADIYRQAGKTHEAATVVESVVASLQHSECEALVSPAVLGRALLLRGDLQFTQGQYTDAKSDCLAAIALTEQADTAATTTTYLNARLTLCAAVNRLDGPFQAQAALGDVETFCRRDHSLPVLGRFYYMSSKLAIAANKYAEAERLAREGLRCAERVDDKVRAMLCQLNLGAILQHLGQTESARRALQAASELAEAAHHMQGVSYAWANRADLALSEGQYAQAIPLFEQALHAVEGLDDRYLETCVVQGLTYAFALTGRTNEALTMITPYLRRLRSSDAESNTNDTRRGNTHSRKPIQINDDAARLLTGLGYLHLRRGDQRRAWRFLTRASAYFQSQQAEADYYRAQLAVVSLSLQAGRSQQVRETLLRLLEGSTIVNGLPTVLLEARHLPELWPMLRQMDHPQVQELLRLFATKAPSVDATTEATATATTDVGAGALGIVNHKGIQATIHAELCHSEALTAPDASRVWEMARVARTAAQHRSRRTVVGETAASSDDADAQQIALCQEVVQELPAAKAAQIAVYALQDARVELDGQRMTAWRRAKQRELFFYFVSESTPISHDQVLDAIWPDTNPEKAEKEFNRIRAELKAVFGQPCVRQIEGHRWQFALEVIYDVDCFLWWVEEGEKLVAKEQIAAAATHFRKALSYWRGPYLMDCYSEWASCQRGHLQKRHTHALKRLADLEMDLSHFEAAAELYATLIVNNSYDEAAYRGLMRALAARGELTAALTQYKHCAFSLEELGTEPSMATQELRRQILSKLEQNHPRTSQTVQTVQTVQTAPTSRVPQLVGSRAR